MPNRIILIALSLIICAHSHKPPRDSQGSENPTRELPLAHQGTKCYNVAQPQNNLKKEATMKSALKKVYKSLMHAYFGRGSLTKDILDFRGVGFLPRQKLKLLKRYKAHLHAIDSLLYTKLCAKEREVLIMWLLKRWVIGGADIADDFWRAKINLAFIQGEKLYHSRNSAQSPITIPFENQEILYHTSCPLPHHAHSTEQSIAFYPIVHTFCYANTRGRASIPTMAK